MLLIINPLYFFLTIDKKLLSEIFRVCYRKLIKIIKLEGIRAYFEQIFKTNCYPIS